MSRYIAILSLISAIGVTLGCAHATSTPTPTTTPTAELPTPTSTPTAMPSAFTTPDVVRRVAPSVVHIRSESVELDLFLRPVPVEGAGTGIVFDTRGYIVTNNHVVAGAQQITVTLANDESYEARLVGGDVFVDLAVIQIDAQDLVPAEFGDSLALEMGEDVVAIGQAFDLPGGPTVTKGVISAKERYISVGSNITLDGVIQTDAAINPGNSGGPLLNMRGQVVGINSAHLNAGEGLGFAIGVDAALPVIDDLIRFGKVQRAFLGITPVNVTKDLVARFELAVDQGVIVADVAIDSPADLAGLRQGDVIVSIGRKAVSHTGNLTSALRFYKPGDSAEVAFFRGEDRATVRVEFGGL